jgi:hypothetical protein
VFTITGTAYLVCSVFLASASDSAAIATLYGTAMSRLCSRKSDRGQADGYTT